MNRPAHGVVAETHEPTAPVVLRMQNRQLRCRSCWGGWYRILNLAVCCFNPLSLPQGLRASSPLKIICSLLVQKPLNPDAGAEAIKSTARWRPSVYECRRTHFPGTLEKHQCPKTLLSKGRWNRSPTLCWNSWGVAAVCVRNRHRCPAWTV